MIHIKKLLKPATMLPVIIGVVAGAILFILGYTDDAPGLSLIGLVVAFLLTMRGIYNAGVVKKGLHAPIILFCFGAGGLFLSIILLLDGEFGNSPGLAFIGVVIGVVLIVIGMIRLRKAKAGA
jgi:hypothetical protein